MYSEPSARSVAMTAPPFRRRRPAFSCLQCRQRKIKCDQKKPCNQCQRYRDVLCTYPATISACQAPKNRQGMKVSQPSKPRARYEPQNEFLIPTPESSTAEVSAAHSPVSSGGSILTEPALAENRAGYPNHHTIDGLSSESHLVITKTAENLSFSIQSAETDRNVFGSKAVPDLERQLWPFPFKTKLFGESHYMNQFLQFHKVSAFLIAIERSQHSGPMSGLKLLLQKCKVLGRAIKSAYPLEWVSIPHIISSIPSREICDELVGNYFRTFECIHRILHIPSFMNEYAEFWSDPHTESNYCSKFVKILLVLAIGTVFCTGSKAASLRTTARQWVFSAQQWLSAPLEKSRMNLSGIQIQCLLILAREALGIGADLLWISAGTLLRSAMQLRLYRDPKHFPGMSVLHAEMSRRLWATTIEMVLQASFHSAMPPLITMDDFDTLPPANINDIDIGRHTTSPILSQPLTTFTQASIQILLRQSLPTRIEIARTSTSLDSEISYDDVLRLGTEIANSCREIGSYTSTCSEQQFSPFGRNHLDLLIRRPLVILHRPWAVKARTNPHYYFSRKVLLETSLTIFSSLPSEDWKNILLVGQGISRETGSLPAVNVALELIMQLEEEERTPPSDMQLVRAKTAREPLIKVLRDATSLGKQRVSHGEVNVRCQFVMALLLAQVEAMEERQNVDWAIMDAARGSLEESYETLKARVSAPVDQAVHENRPVGIDSASRDLEDGFNCDLVEDPTLGFDMSDSLLFGDWEEPSWL